MEKEMNYKQIFAKKAVNQHKIKTVCPNINNESGIYFLLREENGFKYAYIGQAVHIVERLCSHLEGYEQHIDLSLKKHKLWSEKNPTGWRIQFLNFPTEQLDEKEQYYIKLYANAGYQLRNKTTGSQGQGKVGISENKESRGYRDGLKQGYKNAQRDVAKWFDKSLNYSVKGTPNKTKEKILKKFEVFLTGGDTNGMA